jgi:hypothetical protein
MSQTKITDEMVERAARAMWEATPSKNLRTITWGEVGRITRGVFGDRARAVLEAALTEDDTEWEYRLPGDLHTYADIEQLRRHAPTAGIERRRRATRAGAWEPVPADGGVDV